MSFMRYVPVRPPHTCPRPRLIKLGDGTVWRCDGKPDRLFQRSYDGCGKVYQVRETLFGKTWDASVWPPSGTSEGL